MQSAPSLPLQAQYPALTSRRMIPNCTAKVKGERQGYIADTVLAFKDVLSLVVRRPIDRGYVVSWDLQRDIWTR